MNFLGYLVITLILFMGLEEISSAIFALARAIEELKK
jgi:hypothetical protein